MANHHGHNHEIDHEHEVTTLRNAIKKYDVSSHPNDNKDHHHSHDHGDIETEPEYHTSDDWDLESEIKGINNKLKHDKNESEDYDHNDEEHHEEHGHIHDEEHDHNLDDGHHHNAPKNTTQSNLDQSMFLTLQNGR